MQSDIHLRINVTESLFRKSRMEDEFQKALDQ